MGRRWRSLKDDNEEEYERFQEMAKDDKNRFVKESEEFVHPKDSKSKKAKKSPSESKRAKSAYMFFCENTRPILKEEGISGKEIMVELGKRWKECGVR